MPEDTETKRMVRFFLPPGLDADAMAKAIQEIRTRAMQEAAEEKQAAERNIGRSRPRIADRVPQANRA